MTGKPPLDPATLANDGGVTDCTDVGHYGVHTTWTCGHSTGIYTWDRIRAIAGDA